MLETTKLYLGKELYFRKAYMKNRTTSIDNHLLASPSQCEERIRVFQRKLYIIAKQDKNFKAFSLYGKLYEDITLIEAYRRVKSNVDGPSFEDIEKQGLKTFL